MVCSLSHVTRGRVTGKPLVPFFSTGESAALNPSTSVPSFVSLLHPIAHPEASGSSFASTDRSQGGLTLEEASTRMRAGLGNLEAWGLENEVVEWGYALPTYEDLHEALFQRAAILEWETVKFRAGGSLPLLIPRPLCLTAPRLCSACSPQRLRSARSPQGRRIESRLRSCPLTGTLR